MATHCRLFIFDVLKTVFDYVIEITWLGSYQIRSFDIQNIASGLFRSLTEQLWYESTLCRHRHHSD